MTTTPIRPPQTPASVDQGRAPGVPSRSAAPVPSECLLCGRKIVEIEHNGTIYRLQATRQGKLILTK